MNYELAKQLKDAGFPQIIENRIHYHLDCEECIDGNYELAMPLEILGDIEYEIAIPTLSELIEECGDKFASLDKRPDWKENDSDEIGFWHCWGRLENNKLHVAKTPEEAVAKLYLEIRKLST